MYFLPSAFALNTCTFDPVTFLPSPGCGTFGNSNRRFFHGPGLNNWDLALVKDTRITESKSLQFRAETFNTWNHAQFENPDGNIDHVATFGFVTAARDARIMQLGAKLVF